MNISDLDNEARRAVLRQLRNAPIDALDPAFPQAVNIPSATYSPWRGDEAFQRVHEAARNHTLVDIYRCYELWTLAGRLGSVPGDVLEVGTWRGGTGSILAAACARSSQAKTVFLCDTFEGVVKAGGKDTLYKGGEHADTSQDLVVKLLESLGLTNTRILKGIFPEQTGAEVADRQFAFCHIDVDVYAAVSDCLEYLHPRMAPGGFIVLDDYGFPSCPGARRAVDEFFAGRPEAPLCLPTGQCLIVTLP